MITTVPQSTFLVYVAYVLVITFACLNKCLIDLFLKICLFTYKYLNIIIDNFKYYRSNKSVSDF